MTSILDLWWQILLAALAYFALGAIWFNPKVFGTAWADAHGIVMNEEDKKKVNMTSLFIQTFIGTILLTTIISKLCMMSYGGAEACHAMGITHCIKMGLMVGVAASVAIYITYLYLMKPLKASIIDSGYHIVGCVLASCILYALGCC